MQQKIIDKMILIAQLKLSILFLRLFSSFGTYISIIHKISHLLFKFYII